MEAKGLQTSTECGNGALTPCVWLLLSQIPKSLKIKIKSNLS